MMPRPHINDVMILSIEGPDQVGKDTQAKLLRSHYENAGLKSLVVEVPIKTWFTYSLIYFMLRRGYATKYPRFFHFLQFMNKFWWQAFALPLLTMKKYDVIILDRWNGSYWVYGLASGVPANSRLMRMYHVLIKPDHAFVLLGRSHVAEVRDEYEASESLQNRVRKGYREWAFDDKNNVTVVHANQAILDVHGDIVKKLQKLGLDK